mgnify:CR=1 FL=1
MRPDAVVAGAGFAGGILARELAEAGENVLVLERRQTIAGNMFDEVNADGILVQRYGPHSFHTNDRAVYDYVCRFAQMEPYRLTYRAIIKGIPVPCPFNFTAIRQLYPPEKAEELIHRLRAGFPDRTQVSVFGLLDSPDPVVKAYAEMLFEEDFRPYTAKQWGRRPEEIDPSVIRRVPVLLNERDSYFDDLYECQPRHGFTRMFDRMLRHARIEVRTGIDARSRLSFDEAAGLVRFDGAEIPRVIYTGALDELFQCRFGPLPYRSLRFEWESLPVDSHQETAIVAYPKGAAYTRITEYTKLPPQYAPGRTVIAREYPLAYDRAAEEGNEPYYPVAGAESHALRDRYLDLAKRYRNLTLCGRLADYRYYNMEDVVRRALEVAGRLTDRQADGFDAKGTEQP